MFEYHNKEKNDKDSTDRKTQPSFSKQQAPNLTGIPANTKTRFENLSGFSFDDVRVHYNSDKPAQLQALAYTQGNQVYVAPGQDRYLEHELGHVIQQKQGVVNTTVKNASGVEINDSEYLEKEADLWSKKNHEKEMHPSNADMNAQPAQRKKIIQMTRTPPSYFKTPGVDKRTIIAFGIRVRKDYNGIESEFLTAKMQEQVESLFAAYRNALAEISETIRLPLSLDELLCEVIVTPLSEEESGEFPKMKKAAGYLNQIINKVKILVSSDVVEEEDDVSLPAPSSSSSSSSTSSSSSSSTSSDSAPPEMDKVYTSKKFIRALKRQNIPVIDNAYVPIGRGFPHLHIHDGGIDLSHYVAKKSDSHTKVVLGTHVMDTKIAELIGDMQRAIAENEAKGRGKDGPTTHLKLLRDALVVLQGFKSG